MIEDGRANWKALGAAKTRQQENGIPNANRYRYPKH